MQSQLPDMLQQHQAVPRGDIRAGMTIQHAVTHYNGLFISGALTLSRMGMVLLMQVNLSVL